MIKGLIVFSNDMEDVEALATRALLIRAGYQIDSITFQDTKKIKTAFGLNIEADFFEEEIDLNDYDLLIIPGGKYVSYTVDEDHDIKDLARTFKAQNKVISAICAGPRFLGQIGLLDDVNFTAYTGSQKDMPKGIYQPDKKMIEDKGIITARGAGAVYEFVYGIISHFSGQKHAEQLLQNVLY